MLIEAVMSVHLHIYTVRKVVGLVMCVSAMKSSAH